MFIRAILLSLAATIVGAQSFKDTKSAETYFREGATENKKGNVQLAKEKFGRAVEKAKAKGENEWAVRSLWELALIAEKGEPPDLTSAKSNYQEIVGLGGDKEDVKKIIESSNEKIKSNGVDVWLDLFERDVEMWRARKSNNTKELYDIQNNYWGKISPLGKDCVYGMTRGLERKAEATRNFCAKFVMYQIEKEGIEEAVKMLESKYPEARAGAGQALQYIFAQYAQINQLHALADDFEYDVSNLPTFKDERNLNLDKLPEDLRKKIEEARKFMKDHENDKEKVKELTASLRAKAKEFQFNMPYPLESATGILNALAGVIRNEEGDPSARVEAITVLKHVKNAPTDLVKALADALGSRNERVRDAACNASPTVDPKNSPDKHMLVDKLMEILKYQPERDEKILAGLRDKEKDLQDDIIKYAPTEPEKSNAAKKLLHEVQAQYDSLMANSAAVRKSAAMAMGQIGLVKAMPVLIAALDDNDVLVRERASDALIQISGENVEFDANAPLDQPLKSRNQQGQEVAVGPARKDAIDAWTKKWEAQHGVDILFRRIGKFISNWMIYPANEVFDQKDFLEDNLSHQLFMTEPDKEIKMATFASDKFAKTKDLLLLDLSDVDDQGIEFIQNYLDGSAPGLSQKMRVVRMFAGAALARIAEKGNSKGADTLGRNLDGGATDLHKAGAAYGIGQLGPDRGSSFVSALNRLGPGGASPEVRNMCAYAMGRVGNATTLDALSKMIADQDSEVRKAALKAMWRIHKGKRGFNRGAADAVKSFIKTGADLSRETREWAARALGSAGKSSGSEDVSDLCDALVYTRQNIEPNVRTTSSDALKELAADARKETISKRLKDILGNKASKIPERVGASLGLGDISDETAITLLVQVVRTRGDHNHVRAACVSALGDIKDLTYEGASVIVEAIVDDSPDVRRGGFGALKEISGAEFAEIEKKSGAAGVRHDWPVSKLTDYQKAAKAWLDQSRSKFK